MTEPRGCAECTPDGSGPCVRHCRELERLIADARGIDPTLECPSLESLLAGTEFADQLPPTFAARRGTAETGDDDE